MGILKKYINENMRYEYYKKYQYNQEKYINRIENTKA